MTETIGKITLNLDKYPGEDYYCDGSVEDEILDIVKKYSTVEYDRIIAERKSWPILYHLSALRENIVDFLPIKKTALQIEKAKVAAKNRDELLEAAKNGDEDAMESLTIEDLDLYSMASRRATREDIYSIVDTTFMPSGIECDQYSILGEIKEVICKKNRFTGEEIYDLKVECNDLYFRVGINKMDLLGEPLPGRRFKGKIWMMGTAHFA